MTASIAIGALTILTPFEDAAGLRRATIAFRYVVGAASRILPLFSIIGVVVKLSVLVGLAAAALLAAPSVGLAQKDGARPASAPVVRPNGKSGRPATTPAVPAPVPDAAPTPAAPAPAAAAAPNSAPKGATPAAAPATATGGRYTWCSALTAPPLQRLFSGVFLAPADTTINITAGFVDAIKAKHHPNPQDVQCTANFPTREAAEQERARKMPADVVWRLPAIPVEWVYTAP
jgi:hypothetical protein